MADVMHRADFCLPAADSSRTGAAGSQVRAVADYFIAKAKLEVAKTGLPVEP